MATYLDAILSRHRAEAAADTRSTADLSSRVASLGPARDFRAALAGSGPSVIAEVKRRSPSRGDLHPELDPGRLAQQYAAGGAGCISVLTDRAGFGGSPEDLRAVRSAVSLPVLRKDFTVSANDVLDTRLMGADCVLLIVAALDGGELEHYHGLAVEAGLAVLVETHDETEVDRAVAVGADIIGVNQRDLVTFEVDHDRAVRVGGAIPEGVVKVAESGVRGPGDAARLFAAGFQAVLVGESLVTAEDATSAVRSLLAPG